MSSIYFNPRVDYAFKRVLGSVQNKDLLIDFLNAMLYYGEDRIKDVEIVNPYVQGEIYTQKETYVDVRAKLDDGTEVLVEMQMLNVINFPQRVLYNTAKVYGGQLQRGEEYKRLQKVVGITITNFVLFAEQPESVV